MNAVKAGGYRIHRVAKYMTKRHGGGTWHLNKKEGLHVGKLNTIHVSTIFVSSRSGPNRGRSLTTQIRTKVGGTEMKGESRNDVPITDTRVTPYSSPTSSRHCEARHVTLGLGRTGFNLESL